MPNYALNPIPTSFFGLFRLRFRAFRLFIYSLLYEFLLFANIPFLTALSKGFAQILAINEVEVVSKLRLGLFWAAFGLRTGGSVLFLRARATATLFFAFLARTCFYRFLGLLYLACRLLKLGGVVHETELVSSLWLFDVTLAHLKLSGSVQGV